MRPDNIADLIRRAIRQRVLEPGETLIQDDLATRFGVSRIPLREALRTLAAEGLVTMERGESAFVTSLDVDDMQELYELRLMIEPHLAPLITRRCGEDDVTRLRALHGQMQDVAEHDADGWSNLNWEFHHAIYAVSGGTYTVRLVTQLLNLVEPYSRVYVELLDSMERVQSEHSAMIEAIAARDAAKLSRTIYLHLEGARDGLLAAMTAKQDDVVVERFQLDQLRRQPRSSGEAPGEAGARGPGGTVEGATSRKAVHGRQTTRPRSRSSTSKAAPASTRKP